MTFLARDVTQYSQTDSTTGELMLVFGSKGVDLHIPSTKRSREITSHVSDQRVIRAKNQV